MVSAKERKTDVMKDKICLITGANSGIGKATAIGLAKMGATIVIACRNKERGEKALKYIKRESNNDLIDLMLVDLSSQKEIRQFVFDFKERYKRLDVLINNAGVNLSKRTLTEDGIETTFAVNYLAQFLLSNLLFDLLKTSAPARIVNVASSVQAKSIYFENVNGEINYSQMKAYSMSKLAVVLFTYEFARRFDGNGVTINCLHPGYVRTNMIRNFRKFVKYFFPIISLFVIGPKRGAKTSIYCASSPDVEGVSGKYFKKRKVSKSSKASYDKDLAQKLWELSAKLTNLNS
ncbi:MAG: SDR family oxidoreductase [Promethearchaeota archaeon]